MMRQSGACRRLVGQCLCLLFPLKLHEHAEMLPEMKEVPQGGRILVASLIVMGGQRHVADCNQAPGCQPVCRPLRLIGLQVLMWSNVRHCHCILILLSKDLSLMCSLAGAASSFWCGICCWHSSLDCHLLRVLHQLHRPCFAGMLLALHPAQQAVNLCRHAPRDHNMMFSDL